MTLLLCSYRHVMTELPSATDKKYHTTTCITTDQITMATNTAYIPTKARDDDDYDNIIIGAPLQMQHPPLPQVPREYETPYSEPRLAASNPLYTPSQVAAAAGYAEMEGGEEDSGTQKESNNSGEQIEEGKGGGERGAGEQVEGRERGEERSAGEQVEGRERGEERGAGEQVEGGKGGEERSAGERSEGREGDGEHGNGKQSEERGSGREPDEVKEDGGKHEKRKDQGEHRELGGGEHKESVQGEEVIYEQIPVCK